MQGPVRIEGLRELRRALTAAGDGLGVMLREELRGIGAVVAARARAKVPRGRTGRTAASIRPVILRHGVAVRAGGARVPWYGWLDFGGVRRHEGPRHRHTDRHLQPGRPFVARGRYLYPALDETTAEIERRARRFLDEVFAAAGWG